MPPPADDKPGKSPSPPKDDDDDDDDDGGIYGGGGKKPPSYGGGSGGGGGKKCDAECQGEVDGEQLKCNKGVDITCADPSCASGDDVEGNSYTCVEEDKPGNGKKRKMCCTKA
jgi:hypothetical protein